MTDEDLKKLIESNAKASQRLADSVAQDREDRRKEGEEWRQDRRKMYQWMSRLAAAQADFYEVQGDYLNHVERIDERLTDIDERLIAILERLTPKQD
jgi:hypothetical protein